MKTMLRSIVHGCLFLLASSALFADPSSSSQPAQEKEKVIGIGGFFFRAKDPKSLAKWYLDKLGIDLIPQSYSDTPWKQEAGTTAFAPFSMTSKYFGDPTKVWMLDFRVRNLDAMVTQLQAAGSMVKVDPQTYPNGRFARLTDPEGNPIELWEPKADPSPQAKAP